MEEEVFDYYDTLVLAGGGIKGAAILGAVQWLIDNNHISKVKNYIGTSIGSIISYLLIIGYTPIEIIAYLCSKRVLQKISFFDITSVVNGGAALSFSIIQEELEKMTIQKIGILLTMKELHARFSKNLVCTVFNITKNSTEYITHENHPEIPCLTALRMSCNLPLIFEEFTYNNSVYIDGGISDNFSIEYANTIGKWILGINFSLVKLKPRSELSIVGYLHQLLGICISNNRNRNKFKNNKIIEIKSLTDLSNLNFNISTKEMLDLFSCGYTQISEGF